MKGRSAFLKHNWLGIIMAVAATTLLVAVFTHPLSVTDNVGNYVPHPSLSELLEWHYCADLLVPPGPH